MPTEKELDAARRGIWKAYEDELSYDDAIRDRDTASATSRHSASLIAHVGELATAALIAAKAAAETATQTGEPSATEHPGKKILAHMFEIGLVAPSPTYQEKRLAWAYVKELEARAVIAAETKFKLGDRVQKIRGSSWRGPVVGFYSTAFTPIGYCVESENEPGSVQVWPEVAVAAMPPRSEKIKRLDLHTPGWPDFTHPNGARKFAADGTMLDDKGNRSIFDDVDEGE